MTLDEAIQHCEEVAYQKDLESGFETDNERYAMTDKERIDCKKCAKEHRQLAEWLKELKQLREQTRWIPVSERLPEDDEDVLVQMTDYSMMVDFRTASSSGWFWAEKDDLPIAWMPLPEPYKAGK